MARVEPEASGIKREVGSPVHLLCPWGRRMQQKTINTMLPGEPLVPESSTESLAETVGEMITASLLPSMPFPELLRALHTSGLVFLADLCYVKCPNGFHRNTPEASSKQS